MSPYFSNMQWIWWLWALSAAAACTLTIRGAKWVRWRTLLRLVRGEEGAAYTLSYVLTLPLYLAFICCFVETSMMLLAKIGTVHSAFAAARSGIVWTTAGSEYEMQQRGETAAVRAMAPFASGLMGLRRPTTTGFDAEQFQQAYEDFVAEAGKSPSALRYVQAKYGYASQATTVDWQLTGQDPAKPWKRNVEVTVTYAFPFNTPLIGRLMGSRRDGWYFYDIQSTIALQDEAPQNEELNTGIRYASP